MSDKNLPAKKPAEKKPAVLQRKEKKPGLLKRIARYFRETKSEFKKIVWPTPKQLVNNTAIVISVVVIVGLFTFAIDQVLGSLLKLILRV